MRNSPAIGGRPRGRRYRVGAITLGTLGALGLGLGLGLATRSALGPAPISLSTDSGTYHPAVIARDLTPLRISYQSRWNVDHRISLDQIPVRLRTAFVMAEDKHFFSHRGVDWLARGHAIWQNLVAGEPVRGASTITEQVVRIAHPRSRGLWSRWVETFEAFRLEATQSKAAILSFYLNQVPYAANRRGVGQAARYYFNRDLRTLSDREMLTLAVLVRAPSRFDLFRNPKRVSGRVNILAERMYASGYLNADELARINAATLSPTRSDLSVDAGHFTRWVLAKGPRQRARVHTTLDAPLQRKASALLSERLQQLSARDVQDGALVIIDHRRNEVLSWVVGSNNYHPFGIDAVSTPRQAGSTLKPFLYAMALERGWHPTTAIGDRPLYQPVGTGGIHRYQNYSRRFYDTVTLREALGNSLNIPAVHTIQYVGVLPFLERLRALGLSHLRATSNHYGDGLALGNAEVSLFELTQAYAGLANGGVFRNVRHELDAVDPQRARLFTSQAAHQIGAILADDDARALEFGRGGVLAMPHQVAAKTGTSTDFRDAWALGFDHRFTVGVWMGNLDRTPMRGITGARGPAIVLRALFVELARRHPPQRLARSATPRDAAKNSGERCGHPCVGDQGLSIELAHAPTMAQPSPGLQIAQDPRIPDDLEFLRFLVEGDIREAHWELNGEPLGITREGHFDWPISPGTHSLRVSVLTDSGAVQLGPHRFYVRK
ncbi:MAG: transglycosylase domain-containing protein [Pseudomonadota bacterium]